MRLYVVRHCTTECSAKKIYCGVTDVPLSPEGQREAQRLRDAMRDVKFDLAIASPLLRAKETVAAIVGEREIPILFDDRLKERAFGAFEGRSVEGEEGKPFRYGVAMKYPGGESYFQVAARIYALLDELKEKDAGKNILLVSHGSACRIIRSYFKDMTDEEFYGYSQPNGTVEEYGL